MAAFMAVFARGPINAALDFEHETQHESGTATHEELFSRGVQEIGGAVGVIIFGVALGLIFAVVLASLGPRLGRVSAMQATLRLGVAGFFVVVVVPFLKYPANPPGVGDASSINERTIQYFGFLAVSILLAYTVFRTVEGSNASSAGRTWLGAGSYAVGLAVVFLVFPSSPDEISAPADLVWNFRLASLAGLAVAWLTLSLVMGTLVTRAATVNKEATPDRSVNAGSQS